MVWHEFTNLTTTATMEQKEEDESHKIISTIKALTHRKWMKKTTCHKQCQRQPSIELPKTQARMIMISSMNSPSQNDACFHHLRRHQFICR
jgi:hypothetical protein